MSSLGTIMGREPVDGPLTRLPPKSSKLMGLAILAYGSMGLAMFAYGSAFAFGGTIGLAIAANGSGSGIFVLLVPDSDSR
jgi:hypothetical protein